MSTDNEYLRRFYDPLVIIAALTAIISVSISYASLSSKTEQLRGEMDTQDKRLGAQISAVEADLKSFKELSSSRQDSTTREFKSDMESQRARADAVSNRVLLVEQTTAALAKNEADRVTEHTNEWQRQVDRNSSQAADLDSVKESIAVLRAELDGILITREHPIEQQNRPGSGPNAH